MPMICHAPWCVLFPSELLLRGGTGFVAGLAVMAASPSCAAAQAVLGPADWGLAAEHTHLVWKRVGMSSRIGSEESAVAALSGTLTRHQTGRHRCGAWGAVGSH